MFKRGGARNEIIFNLVSTTQSNISITNIVGNTVRYLVDWGDGNKVPVTNLSTKTFSTPFTGTVSVSMMRGSTKFHVSTYGSMVANGNVRVLLNQNVNYDTFKQISNLKYLYYSDWSGTGTTASTTITGTFSDITDDLTKLKELHLISGNTLSDYRIDINNLKNLDRIWIDNVRNPITGTINNIPTNNPNLDYFSIGAGYSMNHPITGSINSFSQSTIRTFTVERSSGGLNTISGDIRLLPISLETFNLGGLNTTTGSIANLPSSLNSYRNYGNNTTSGNIGSFSSNLTTYINRGVNRTTGDISSLKPNLTLYQNWGNNTTFGDIGLLPNFMTYYANRGLNTTTGSISNLSASMSTYENHGYNTTTGDIGLLPVVMQDYSNQGSNTTYGNIGSFSSNLLEYENEGSNTTTGDIANLPLQLTRYTNFGSNTTFGDISLLKSNLRFFSNSGSSSTTGDIGLLPANLELYYNRGSNTTYGNIASFSTNLINFTNEGFNRTTGDVATLRPIIFTFQCISPSQSTYGNLYLLPTNIRTYYSEGSATCSFTASGGPTKSWNTFNKFIHRPKAGCGLTSSEVDQLLISLETAAWTLSGGSRLLYLDGNNGPRTSFSNTAVLGLSAKGVQVKVNGLFGAN